MFDLFNFSLHYTRKNVIASKYEAMFNLFLINLLRVKTILHYKFSKELVALHSLPGRTYELFKIILN